MLDKSFNTSKVVFGNVDIRILVNETTYWVYLRYGALLALIADYQVREHVKTAGQTAKQ